MGPRRSWTSVAAWAACALSAVLCVALVLMWNLGRAAGIPADKRDPAALTVVVVPTILTFAVIGAFIASRGRRGSIGWLFIGAALSLAAKGATDAYVIYGHYHLADAVPLYRGVAWFSNWSWVPGVGAAATYLFLLFPTGTLPSPRWRVVGWLAAAGIVSTVMNVSLVPGALGEFPYIENPLRAPAALAPIVSALGAGFALLALCAVASAVSLVVRARGACAVERAQIKWIGFAGAIFAVGFAFSTWAQANGSQFGPIEAVSLFLPMCGVAVASAIAIQRYHLFDIDRIVSRTISYAILTALLVGAYVAMVFVLEPMLRAVTGSSGPAVAGSTLGAAALFGPLRARVQSLVDRRFNRTRYDAALAATAFSAQLRSEVEISAVRAELLGAVERTVAPASASLWLR